LGVVSFVELRITLGVTNSTSLCSSLSRGASSIQGLAYGIHGLASKEPTKKKKKEAEIKKVFKEEWATQFPWVEPMVDPTSKIHMVHCKVGALQGLLFG
jgi:hypothetical protein